MDELLRVYFDPGEVGLDGYPYAWHEGPNISHPTAIKDLIREQAGHRCQRCHHPYIRGMGEWSACDSWCRHRGPLRVVYVNDETQVLRSDQPVEELLPQDGVNFVEAQWRILTVHHLNGLKHDCRWWNLVALCQRCHLTIQGKVVMERPWAKQHSEWFKPYAAGYYASALLGEELTREQVERRLPELLDLQLRQNALW